MSAETAWEVLTNRPGRPPATDPGAQTRRRWLPAFLGSGETWLTFSLLIVAFVAVVFSIQSANWVREMPSLVAAGMIGLFTGWALAHAPLRQLPLQLAGFASGLAVALAQTMQTMRLEDPLLNGGIGGRWGELWGRLGEWWQALIGGGISTDPLPFVLMLVFGVWAMSYLAAWSVFRWHNAWFALIPAGFALLTNISYLDGQPSGAFIVFLFAAILLVTRLHYLRALSEWRSQRTWRAPYLSFEVLSAATWVGLALILFAWVVPTANDWGPLADRWNAALSPISDRVDRVGRLFIGVRSNRDLPLHSFSDTLPLKGAVELDGEEVLLRVVAPERPEALDGGVSPLYLRGAVYDEYTAQGWKVSDAGTAPLLGTSVEAATFGTPATLAQARRPIAVEITVERSIASRRLFSAGDPLAADVEARLLTDGSGEPIGLVPDSKVRDGDTYSTVGSVSAAPLERLLLSGRAYPDEIRDRYLQVPDGLPPEIGELAQRVTAGLDQPFVVARAVEAFLRGQFAFDLNIERRPPRRDAVAYFLFDSQRGYFDQYASAMAVMLRTLGIPARVATGFTLDDFDFDTESKSYEVTEQNSWTWPEVYFNGLGWVEFNPTPSQPTVARPGDLGLLGGSVADDNLDELEDVFLRELNRAVGDQPIAPVIGAGGGGGFSGRFGEIAALVLTWGSLVGALLVAAAVAARAFWAYRFRGLGAEARRWAKLQQLAQWAGLPMGVTMTPLESARRLVASTAADFDLRPLALAYSRERYGAAGTDDGERDDEDERERLNALYFAARNLLMRRVLGRLLRPWRRSAGRQAVAGRP